MRHISLGNLLLGLEDLLTKRIPALQRFEAGKASIKTLTKRRDAIAALPPELTGRPLAQELSLIDSEHDGFGGAIWFLTEAYLRLPGATKAMIDAAYAIRAAFVPSLDVLKARYDAEAQAAKEHAPALATLKKELAAFPVVGGTLHDWAAGFIAAGKQMDTLLSQRADTKDRKAATVLRGEALSKLNRLREDLADAVKDDPTLPVDLEDQVFGYLDLLEKNDATAAAEEKKKAADAAKKSAPETANEA
jgi:hypothetical protein